MAEEEDSLHLILSKSDKNVQMGQICNLALKKNAAFAATILTKLTNTTLTYVKILYTEFYPNWS
jgi:hypothetical protein